MRPGVCGNENAANVFLERSNTSRVQLKMSRVRVILVVVMPALFLLVSADCFGDPTASCDNLPCLLSAQRSGKNESSSADNSLGYTVQHSSRRVNVQSGTGGFGAPVALAQTATRPEHTTPSFVPLPASLELIQSWQFLWRTSLEPRAPSLVS
jgi:hypothetical protein